MRKMMIVLLGLMLAVGAQTTFASPPTAPTRSFAAAPAPTPTPIPGIQRHGG